METMRSTHCCANAKYELASILRSESDATWSSGELLGAADGDFFSASAAQPKISKICTSILGREQDHRELHIDFKHLLPCNIGTLDFPIAGRVIRNENNASGAALG